MKNYQIMKQAVVITGTPSTGKTTISEMLKDKGYPVIDVGKLVKEDHLYEYYDEESDEAINFEYWTDTRWKISEIEEKKYVLSPAFWNDEELEARPTLGNLPEKDLEHISGDIQRLYDHLASEWLDYIAHLKSNYPFLFSLVLRTHPFQENPSPILT